MLKLYPIDQKVVQYSRKKVWKDLLVAGALLFYTFCAMVLEWRYRIFLGSISSCGGAEAWMWWCRGMDAVVQRHGCGGERQG